MKQEHLTATTILLLGQKKTIKIEVQLMLRLYAIFESQDKIKNIYCSYNVQ